LEDREALLKSLASHLVDKIIIDVTNVFYFFGESHWGQISSTLLNRDALGAPARWTTAFKAVYAVCLELQCSQKTLGISLEDELRFWTSHFPQLQFHPARFIHYCLILNLYLFIFLIVVLLSKIWLLVHVQHFLREDLPDVNNPHTTFVAGDDPEAVATTIALVEVIPGFKAANAGPLENSRIVELLGPRWLGELDKLNAGGKLSTYWKLGV